MFLQQSTQFFLSMSDGIGCAFLKIARRACELNIFYFVGASLFQRSYVVSMVAPLNARAAASTSASLQNKQFLNFFFCVFSNGSFDRRSSRGVAHPFPGPGGSQVAQLHKLHVYVMLKATTWIFHVVCCPPFIVNFVFLVVLCHEKFLTFAARFAGDMARRYVPMGAWLARKVSGQSCFQGFTS